MITFSPANLELLEYTGTTSTTVIMIPDTPVPPQLSQAITITNVTVSPSPSDLSISWNNNQFTFSSKFGDMFNKTYKYLIYDAVGNNKTYYSVSKIAQVSSNMTGFYQYIPPASDLMEITFTISTSVSDVIRAGGFVVGKTYTIVTPNDTNFVAIGATNNTAGTTFVATGNGSAATPTLIPGKATQVFPATTLVAGNTYKITTLGSADWVALGATAAILGTVFVALGSGTGTGDANQLITAGRFVVGTTYVIIDPGTTVFTNVGAVDSVAGTIFTATAAGLGTGTVAEVITAGNFTTGSSYKILTVADTVWTDIGSANNTVATIFVSTGNGLTENTPGTASVSSISGTNATWILDLRYNSSSANSALQTLAKSGTTSKIANKTYPELK